MSQSPAESENLNPLLQGAESVLERGGGNGHAGAIARLKVSADALRALPADFVKRHRVLPFKIDNGTIHVATSEPGNQRLIDDIRLLSGFEVQETQAPG